MGKSKGRCSQRTREEQGALFNRSSGEENLVLGNKKNRQMRGEQCRGEPCVFVAWPAFVPPKASSGLQYLLRSSSAWEFHSIKSTVPRKMATLKFFKCYDLNVWNYIQSQLCGMVLLCDNSNDVLINFHFILSKPQGQGKCIIGIGF